MSHLPLAHVVELAVYLGRCEAWIEGLFLAKGLLEAEDVRQVDGAPVPMRVKLSDGGVPTRKSSCDKNNGIAECSFPLARGHVALEGVLDRPQDGERPCGVVARDEVEG